MKKLLLLFAVLLSTVSGWAQDVFVEPVAGSYYYIKGMSSTVPYLSNQNVAGNTSIATVATAENAGVFTIEEVGGTKYVKCVNSPNDNIYLYKGSSDVSLGTDANKHVVSIEVASSEDCTYYINVNNGSYMHNNKDAGIGTGKIDASLQNKWGFIKTQRPLMGIGELDNAKVYYLRTSRGALFYESGNPYVLASTSFYDSVDASSPSAEWAIYQREGKYYFYNIAARKFIGKNSVNAGRLPMTIRAYDDVQISATSTKANYPFVFSTDNSGAINHFHPTDNKNAPGVANWASNGSSGGLSSPNDDGSAHKILEVRDLTADEISAIEKGLASIPQDKEFVLKSGNNNYMMDKRTAPTNTKAGRFQFVSQEGSLSTYKIKSIDENKWVSYDPAQTTGDGQTKAILVDDEADAKNWCVIEYSAGLYQISPFDANGNKVSRYWNWYGGINNNGGYSLDDPDKTVGYYENGGNDDSGSRWSFYEVAMPEKGTEYVLYDKTHNLFLDIKNLVQEPGFGGYNQVACLSSDKETLFVTPKEEEPYSWEIHTTAEGGSYLMQYNDAFIATTSIANPDHYYNSLVASKDVAGDFYWTAEFRILDGKPSYVLRNTSENSPGYLGISGHTNDKALRVDRTAEGEQLKLVLHKASDCYSVVANNGYVVYDGEQYANGDFILSDGTLTEEMLSVAELLGYDTDLSINEETKTVTITYSVDVTDFKEGDKFLIKNRDHANDYICADFSGGKLDNSEEPTTKRISYQTKNGSNIDYRFCWELKATTHNEEQCFYLYNPYYDWYVGLITGTTSDTRLSKTEEQAGKYKIEKEGDYFVFHCLTSTVEAGGQDGNFFHWYTWSGSKQIVGWQRSAPASQWQIEEVTEEMETQWQNALTSQFNNLTQHELGTGIGQYSGMPENLVEGFNALSLPEEATAIEKARYCVYALYDYASAVEALEINQPAAGFYRIKSQNVANNNLSGKYLQLNANNTGLEESNDATIRSIVYINDAKNLLHYSIAQYQNSYAAPAAIGSEASTWEITENPKALGKYSLKVSGNSSYLSDWNGTIQGGSNSTNEVWTFEEVTSLPFTFKAAALGYATFNAPVNVDLDGTGVVAYIAEIIENESKLKIRKIEGNVVPANTPVLLYNEDVTSDDVSVNFNIDNVTCNFTAKDLESQNNFYGTLAAKETPADVNVYSLQKSSTENMVGFFKKSATTTGETPTSTTMAGFKAWITTPKTPDAARSFTIIFDGDNATGLKEALGLENENVEIYDLSGRRLDKPAKGVNVIGGKLVVK